jgi:hypothetical protein
MLALGRFPPVSFQVEKRRSRTFSSGQGLAESSAISFGFSRRQEATVANVKRIGGIVGEVHNRTIHHALIDVLKGRWPASR